ncbi:MAG: cytochrome c [Candidatus Kapabacteria bacterium]|nr:cytochrome c [Candidatus Kapabacteria bacterium]
MKVKFPILWGTLGLATAVFVALLLTGNIMWFSEDAPLQVIADMDNQFRVKPQTGSTLFADRKSNRDPIENTVPRDGHVYPFSMGDVDKAEAQFASGNPVKNSEFVLARGQNRFNTFCSPCHNYTAGGDGLVQKKGFGAQETMNLTRDVARGYTDGKLFHIISVGQNIMPAYGDRINEADRWAIVHYVRELQSKAAAKEGVSMPAPATPAVDTTQPANGGGK